MNKQTRNMGSFLISNEILQHALNIPENILIVGCQWDFAGGSLRIFVEGEPLPQINVGEMIPAVFPKLKQIIDDKEKMSISYEWK